MLVNVNKSLLATALNEIFQSRTYSIEIMIVKIMFIGTVVIAFNLIIQGFGSVFWPPFWSSRASKNAKIKSGSVYASLSGGPSGSFWDHFGLYFGAILGSC